MTAASSCWGNGDDLLTLKWIHHKGQWSACWALPTLSAVFSFVLSLDLPRAFLSLEEIWPTSQVSSLILGCPETAVSPIRAHVRRYPILHLCHSQPADQQSNFTQACTEAAAADVGMRIFLSTRTRRYLKCHHQCRKKKWAQTALHFSTKQQPHYHLSLIEKQTHIFINVDVKPKKFEYDL